MKTLKIVIGSNAIRCKGFDLTEVRADLDRWFSLIGEDQARAQAQIDALTAQLKTSTDQLHDDVARTNPGAAGGG